MAISRLLFSTASVLPLLVLVAASAASAATNLPPQVMTESGMLQGVSADGVEYFKGIPYAAPPVGPLRWEPPRPTTHWQGVRDASAFDHDCMQPLAPGLRTTPSEDCLYLNIWRPEGNPKKLPVMVWIYGGGFVNGGSSAFDGSQFATDGVIFVSFNYRLGRFGFFGFPALTAADPNGLLGNYGYMDQIAALQWVKVNIAAFGGDPNNITIFGESAGGASVNALLTSPLGVGLFNKAIVESGAGRKGSFMGDRQLSKDLPNLESAETIGVNFARANDIVGTGPEALTALRALPADKFIDGLDTISDLAQASDDEFMRISHIDSPTYTLPMIDGKIAVRSPGAVYESGRFAHVPLMLGANSADLGVGALKTLDDVFDHFGADKQAAEAAYGIGPTTDIAVAKWEVTMDNWMVEQARYVAREFSRRGLPVYEYRFSYVSPVAEAVANFYPNSTKIAAKSDPKFYRFLVRNAQHAGEIPYVFNTLGADATAEDRQVAKEMHAYWVNFAKTENPNPPHPTAGVPQWPVYTAAGDRLMNFTQHGPEVMADPWKARLDLTAAHGQPMQ